MTETSADAMRPEDVPDELARMLDDDAGREHGATGPVMASLGRILARHEEMVRERVAAETSAGETGGLCPTGCDPGCDADCHETHDVRWKREHQPEQCPARAGETGGREALTDERLAEIRAHHDEYGFVGATDVDSIVAELLAEVERLNEVLHANTVIRNAAESTGRVYKSLAAALREDRNKAREEWATAAQRAETAERELAEMRERIGPPETVWGHQVHADDGHINPVHQCGEFAARKAVEYMNTQVLGPDAGARAKLVVHEVWHAETEWRVVEDGR